MVEQTAPNPIHVADFSEVSIRRAVKQCKHLIDHGDDGRKVVWDELLLIAAGTLCAASYADEFTHEEFGLSIMRDHSLVQACKVIVGRAFRE